MDSISKHPGHPVPVHKAGAEGVIEIDSLSGQVLTKADERPEWAAGYAVALYGERAKWYTTRLGDVFATSISKPTAYVADDLAWLALDAEGDEVEIEASTDYRMGVLAAELGADHTTGEIDQYLAEVEMADNPTRTAGEVYSLTEAERAAFPYDVRAEEEAGDAKVAHG